jgi:diacylglycerol kinase family enzyme
LRVGAPRRARPRLLLIANGNARSVTPFKQDVIARALSAESNLEVVETAAPGHATDLARDAAREGLDLVIAMGGDGTVNEVVNGLAGTRTPLAVLPAGGVNVFARSIGLPEDPVEATGLLLQRLRLPPRPIALGRIEGRYFTMSCGVGLDAAIVRKVEQRQRLKRTVGDSYFIWTGLRTFFLGYGRRRPRITLIWGDGPEERRSRLHLVIAQKADPYTFLGKRPMRLCPDAAREGGLDCVALETMRTSTILRLVLSSFGRARHTRFRRVLHVHDRPALRIECDEPMPVQTDGEYVGDGETFTIASVPDALLLCC